MGEPCRCQNAETASARIAPASTFRLGTIRSAAPSLEAFDRLAAATAGREAGSVREGSSGWSGPPRCRVRRNVRVGVAQREVEEDAWGARQVWTARVEHAAVVQRDVADRVVWVGGAVQAPVVR
jgi:hypothetical protein